jgi:hypothetical protein
MGWIVLSWALTVGSVPQQYQEINFIPNNNIQTAYPSTMAEVELSAEILNHLKLWGSVKTFQYLHLNEMYCSPYRSDYAVGISIYNKIMEIGIRHECDHPVIYEQNQLGLYGMMTTEIYIKLRGYTRF